MTALGTPSDRAGSAALVAGGAATVVVAVVATVLQARDIGVFAAVAYQLPGIALIGAAMVLDRRFQLRGVAAIVLAAAWFWCMSNLGLQDQQHGLRAFGTVFLNIPAAALFHAILALPSGRLRYRWERIVTTLSYLFNGVVLGLAGLSAPIAAGCVRCVAPVLHLSSGASDALAALGGIGGALAAAASATLQARRWRRASGGGRRLMRPVLAAAALLAVVYIVTSLTPSDGTVANLHFDAPHARTDALVLAEMLATTLLALSFPFGAWRASRAVGAFGRLAPRLGHEPSAQELEQLLGSALGDPTVTVNLDPSPVAEVPPPHRALADVTFGGTLLARIEHAHPLLIDGESFETVLGTLGVLLGRRRLNDELRRPDVPDTALDAALDRAEASAREATLSKDLRDLRDAFTSFVGADLTERVTGSEGFAGSTVEASIMFIDLRDFTRFAERRSPAEVVTLLNSFWELVVPVVVHHGGHANRFIGDGMLAVFGAPEPLEHHADAALDAAGDIARRVAENYGDTIGIGIGVNTGEVAADLVGGGGRYEFTVIGDVVNTASRVEAATRTTGDTVLVTEATVARASRVHPLVDRGTIELKGKSAPVHVYALVAGQRGERAQRETVDVDR